MNYVDDAMDIAVSVVMAACMIVMGIWCQGALLRLYHEPLVEKTAPNTALHDPAPPRNYSASDCLLEMVCNDAYCPDPAVVLFQRQVWNSNNIDDTRITRSCLVKFDPSWFNEKEVSIEGVWSNFFRYVMDCDTSDWELQFNADGTPKQWVCTLYKKSEVPAP